MKETGTVKKFFSQHSLDVAGFWISAVCGLHCVAVPLLVSLAAIRVSSLLVHSMEYLALGFSVTLGVVSLLPSFFKRRYDHEIKNIAEVYAQRVLIRSMGLILSYADRALGCILTGKW